MSAEPSLQIIYRIVTGRGDAGLDVLVRIGRFGHEDVHIAVDPATGLQAIIAIHSTSLGPALGGTRFLPYRRFDDALEDVLGLSRAMTYKAAAADLPLGGGKAVIIGDPAALRSEALLRAYGRAVEALGGRYVTAEDVGTTVADMVVVRRETAHVTGLPVEHGGSGDPSPATAHGVLAAMRGVAEDLWGKPGLEGRRVVIQGVGKVGGALARLLADEGCDIVVGDIATERAEAVADRLGAKVVAPDRMLTEPCDILAPCALGGVLNADTIPTLACTAVVGSANNQLSEEADAERLEAAGILYAPDFIVNAGGIINIAEELHPAGYSQERALDRVHRIGESITRVLNTARDLGITTLAAALAVADERLEVAGE